MKPKHPRKTRPARRLPAPATDAPPAEAGDVPDEPEEQGRPAPADVQRADEHAAGSIETVAEDEADGGVDATLDESAKRPRGP